MRDDRRCLVFVFVCQLSISSVFGQDVEAIITALTDHKDVCGDHKWQAITPSTRCGTSEPCDYKKYWCAEESGTLACVSITPSCQQFLPEPTATTSSRSPPTRDTTVFSRTNAPSATAATLATAAPSVTTGQPQVPAGQKSGLITLFCGGCQCDCKCGMAPPCQSGAPQPAPCQTPPCGAGSPNSGAVALPSAQGQSGAGTPGSQGGSNIITVPGPQGSNMITVPGAQSPNIITLPSSQSSSCSTPPCGGNAPASPCGSGSCQGAASAPCGGGSCGVPAPPPLVAGAPEPGGLSQCSDNHHRCNAWAARGECGYNPRYMHKKCSSSCGGCRFKVL